FVGIDRHGPFLLRALIFLTNQRVKHFAIRLPLPGPGKSSSRKLTSEVPGKLFIEFSFPTATIMPYCYGRDAEADCLQTHCLMSFSMSMRRARKRVNEFLGLLSLVITGAVFCSGQSTKLAS